MKTTNWEIGLLSLLLSSLRFYSEQASSKAFVTGDTGKDGYKVTISAVLNIQCLLYKSFSIIWGLLMSFFNLSCLFGIYSIIY